MSSGFVSSGMIVIIDAATDRGRAMLCGELGVGHTVDASVDELRTESREGMCRRCGARRHLTSGALMRIGVLRGRMGDRTRVSMGDFARSEFVTTSTSLVIVLFEISTSLKSFARLDTSLSWVARATLLEPCTESLRIVGTIADSMFAVSSCEKVNVQETGRDENKSVVKSRCESIHCIRGRYVADISTSLTGSSGIANMGSLRDVPPRGFCKPRAGSWCGWSVKSTVFDVKLDPASFVSCAPS